MHNIEPYHHWRDDYIAANDERSPFHGMVYDEFSFTKRIYNYLIHPQWDEFGSPTLYMKLLYVDYDDGYAVLEFIGEWNDCVTNDIMHLKRNVVDQLLRHGISKYILICENVLNFHGSDECYYEEWLEDIIEQGGWVTLVNTLDHVEQEMRDTRLHHFVNLGDAFTGIDWRGQKPGTLLVSTDRLQQHALKALPY